MEEGGMQFGTILCFYLYLLYGSFVPGDRFYIDLVSPSLHKIITFAQNVSKQLIQEKLQK